MFNVHLSRPTLQRQFSAYGRWRDGWKQVSGVPPQADQVSPLTLRFRRDFRCASTGYQVPGFRGEPVETKKYLDVEDLEVYKCIGIGSS